MTLRMHAAARTAAVLLALGLLALAGCSGDESLAPQDELTLSRDDAAGQSGLVAWALARIGPEFLQDPAGGAQINRSPDQLVFTGRITGICEIVFRDAAGELTTWNLAATGRLTTLPGAPLSFTPFAGSGVAVTVVLDIAAAIEHDPDTALLTGGGSITAANLATVFTLDDVQVQASGWPAGGYLSLNLGGHTAVVAYGGGQTATITIGGATYTVDLETGVTTGV